MMNPLFNVTFSFPFPTKEQLVEFISSYDNLDEPTFSTENVGYALNADVVTDKRFHFHNVSVLHEKPYHLLLNVATYIALCNLADEIQLEE